MHELFIQISKQTNKTDTHRNQHDIFFPRKIGNNRFGDHIRSSFFAILRYLIFLGALATQVRPRGVSGGLQDLLAFFLKRHPLGPSFLRRLFFGGAELGT